MALQFKTHVVRTRWAQCHPELHVVLEALADLCVRMQWPSPVLTSCSRTKEENEAVHGHPESWHLFGCAGDLSSWLYTSEQMKELLTWLRMELARRGGVRSAKLPEGKWELLVHDKGSGEHLHIARRDTQWKRTFKVLQGGKNGR